MMGGKKEEIHEWMNKWMKEGKKEGRVNGDLGRFIVTLRISFNWELFVVILDIPFFSVGCVE